MKKTELLAPAGSMRGAKAAVQSGADAIYIGGVEFSARKSADNFTTEEISELVRYCHLRGVAVHVAANTLIKEKETQRFLEYVGKLNAIGIDALIIQDIGMAKKVHAMYPDLPLHASTQMSAASLEAVKALEAAGFSRVVLAREMSKSQIRSIKKHTNVELEVFCHGALCMCYSGQCLMSSLIGGRSGNRGMCAQPCRLSYTLCDRDQPVKSGYLLSPKDLALVSHLQELQAMGIDSLKIEGRLKRAEYVSAVTGIYRKYLDAPGAVLPADQNALEGAFCRSGFTDFYWQGKTGEGMMSFENPGNVTENRFSDDARARCAEDANFRKIKTQVYACLYQDKPLQITMIDQDGNVTTAEGEIPAEVAVNKPLDRERLSAQLNKLGNTVFLADTITIDMDEGIVIPIGEVNQVRRKVCAQLEDIRTALPVRRHLPLLPDEQTKPKNSTPILAVQTETEEQIEAALSCGIQRIYVPAALYPKYAEAGDEIVARLPAIARPGDPIVDAKRVLVSNIGQVHQYHDRILYGGFRLNVYNGASCEAWQDMELVTLSPELNLGEIREIASPVQTELIVYGRLPLMVFANCPVRAAGKTCQQGKQQFTLKDRRNQIFPLLCGEGCLSTLYNAKPIYMADKLGDVTGLGVGSLRLIFTTENGQETRDMIGQYQEAMAGKNVLAMPENTFTRGHFYRGVQ